MSPFQQLQAVKKKLSSWYLIYELTTSLYMLEPWERKLFNTFLVTFVTMGCYTSYVFLPKYALRLLLRSSDSV